MTLTINGRELNIKYGYEPTLATRTLSKLAKVQDSASDGSLESVENILMYLPELLLMGLQVNYKDEYGFDWHTGEGKEEQISKMYALIDEYCNQDNSDVAELFNKLVEEMISNGFLKSTLLREAAKNKK